jgi:DNA helicase-2/ATP-dependent DNA helicase PcrA
MEEERRLCYVGMTRAMDTLILTRARYRRRYGNDMPESSTSSRFLEEVPPKLIEDLGSGAGYGANYGGALDYRNAYATPYPQRRRFGGNEDEGGERHYSYEDESQDSGSTQRGRAAASTYAAQRFGANRSRLSGSGALDNTAAFFGKGGTVSYKPGEKRYPARPKMDIPQPAGRTGLGKGTRVRHPKYGEGIIAAREGEGDDAKITVQFSGYGTKKLVEKFAQLERL